MLTSASVFTSAIPGGLPEQHPQHLYLSNLEPREADSYRFWCEDWRSGDSHLIGAGFGALVTVRLTRGELFFARQSTPTARSPAHLLPLCIKCIPFAGRGVRFRISGWVRSGTRAHVKD